MAGLYDVVDALKEMGAELKAVTEDATAATESVERYAAAQTRTAGISNSDKSEAVGTASLAAALKAQTGRR